MPRSSVNNLSELIDALGTSRIARACDVCTGTVYHWRTKGLPDNHRATRYRAAICLLGCISENELIRIENGEGEVMVARAA